MITEHPGVMDYPKLLEQVAGSSLAWLANEITRSPQGHSWSSRETAIAAILETLERLPDADPRSGLLFRFFWDTPRASTEEFLDADLAAGELPAEDVHVEPHGECAECPWVAYHRVARFRSRVVVWKLGGSVVVRGRNRYVADDFSGFEFGAEWAAAGRDFRFLTRSKSFADWREAETWARAALPA